MSSLDNNTPAQPKMLSSPPEPDLMREAVKALEPFAAYAKRFEHPGSRWDDSFELWRRCPINVGQLRVARDLLSRLTARLSSPAPAQEEDGYDGEELKRISRETATNDVAKMRATLRPPTGRTSPGAGRGAMTLDELRAAHPQLGFALYAIEPGGLVTLEIYAGEEIYGWTGITADEAIAKAFKPIPPPVNIFD